MILRFFFCLYSHLITSKAKGRICNILTILKRATYVLLIIPKHYEAIIILFLKNIKKQKMIHYNNNNYPFFIDPPGVN